MIRNFPPFRTPDVSQTITIDTERLLIEVKVSGHFLPATAYRASQETRAAIESLGENVGRHVTLYDFSDVEQALPETVEFLRIGFNNPSKRPLHARKVAFLVGSETMRAQAEHIREGRPTMAVFDDREAAIDWLMAP